MKNNPTWVPVVAAALIDPRGRLLMHRRPPHKAHANLWEFPGGKVEARENPREALVRELSEELAIVVDLREISSGIFAESATGQGEMPIVLLLYIVRAWEGIPISQEGGACGWFAMENARGLAMPPLDCDLYRLLAKILAA